jgi:hypothetical protein
MPKRRIKVEDPLLGALERTEFALTESDSAEAFLADATERADALEASTGYAREHLANELIALAKAALEADPGRRAEDARIIRFGVARGRDYIITGDALGAFIEGYRAGRAAERLGLRHLEKPLATGRKVRHGLRAAHERTYGSVAEKTARWAALVLRFEDLARAGPRRPTEELLSAVGNARTVRRAIWRLRGTTPGKLRRSL